MKRNKALIQRIIADADKIVGANKSLVQRFTITSFDGRIAYAQRNGQLKQAAEKIAYALSHQQIRYSEDANEALEEDISYRMQVEFSYAPLIGELCETVILTGLSYWSPKTKSTCVAESIAACLLADKVLINRYAEIKELAQSIHKDNGCEFGTPLDSLQTIADKYNIPLVNLNHVVDIQQPSISVVYGHCIALFPLDHDAVKDLQPDVYEMHDRVMEPFSKDANANQKDIILGYYDFEWTHSSSDFKQWATYAYSFCMGQEDAIVQFGLDCQHDFVKMFASKCDANASCDITLWAHNGQKADYPIIESILA